MKKILQGSDKLFTYFITFNLIRMQEGICKVEIKNIYKKSVIHYITMIFVVLFSFLFLISTLHNVIPLQLQGYYMYCWKTFCLMLLHATKG